MTLSLRDFCSANGKIDRRPYALIGVLGFAIKHNLDRLLATAVFHRPWSVFNYWIPLGQAIRITSLSRQETVFLAGMVALALPFIWIGVALTIRRLNSIGLPPWLVAFFFLPFVNLLFFAILCLLPAKADGQEATHKFTDRLLFAWVIPQSKAGSAAVAIFLTLILGLAGTLLGASFLRSYGWGLFVALPFCLGLVAALVYGYHEPRTLGSCVVVALLSLGMLAGALLAFAIEGVICIFMAAPLALVLTLMGAMLGYRIQHRPGQLPAAPAVVAMMFFLLPPLFYSEHVLPDAPAVFEVRTAIEIDAPPEVVWLNVVAFSEISERRGWLFRAGIAYPMRAEISGHGAGAVRHCVFSTGAFVEPIEVWDEPRLLKFSVTENPPPMREWSFYSSIAPPHLHGFLVSNGGQFRLQRLPGERTRLEGTTWYRHSLWPAEYWRVWSDFIIHRIHLRVLEHIRHESEPK